MIKGHLNRSTRILRWLLLCTKRTSRFFLALSAAAPSSTSKATATKDQRSRSSATIQSAKQRDRTSALQRKMLSPSGISVSETSPPSPETHVTGIDLLRSEVEKLCTRGQSEAGELVSRSSILALIDLMPSASHPDDIAVDRFAASMKAKLAKKREEGRGGWDNPDECSIAFLSELLREHVNKGDPVDVGNLSMMIHQREGLIE